MRWRTVRHRESGTRTHKVPSTSDTTSVRPASSPPTARGQAAHTSATAAFDPGVNRRRAISGPAAGFSAIPLLYTLYSPLGAAAPHAESR